MPDLPSPLTRFIGREPELAALAAMLAEARLVTLIGPGGVGKTRLALQVATAEAARMPDGVVFVDLTPLRDYRLVLPSLAHALEVRETSDRSLHEVLVEQLQGRKTLVVLDNCEQVLEAAPLLAALLADLPDLTVLATSRAALRIAGEQEYAVRPLALPLTANLSTDEAMRTPSVKLFVQRAQLARPHFTLTEANLAAVVQICRRLDGLPLALELAAARVRVLAPGELLARLERRLPLLKGGSLDRPERHRTLRDTIAWSYELLDATSQWRFRQLAVYASGFTLADVLELWAAPAVHEAELIEALAELVEQSLEVLALLVAGHTNRAIADRLMLSVHAVSSHVKAIFGKLGVSTRAAATHVAITRGLSGLLPGVNYGCQVGSCALLVNRGIWRTYAMRRCFNRSIFARPYICRFTCLRRLMW
ncbi:MAG: LuxR C-terminal-related transcriptional regulator, partial [Oscillochloridaceae bacterium umkhey_bin13]